MILSIKELIVILVIATAVFALAKPVALRFVAKDDFARRRNTWYALTIAAFLSPSFVLFAVVAIPLLILTGRKESSPAAFYVFLLQVIPPISVRVPMIGISYLFDIDNYLLLSFCLLTPAALRLFRSKDISRMRGIGMMDVLLLTGGALQSVLYIHEQYASGAIIPASFTDDLRRAFEFFFSIVIPYFVVSRSSSSRKSILDVLATFCLSCALMASIAIFEASRHWLLYGDLANRWGHGSAYTLYLVRAGSVRAMASSGHPLALGYLLVIAFGFWLYLKGHVQSAVSRLAGTVLFWLGLLAANSRGPWIAGAFIYFTFAALRPRALSRVFKAAGIAVIAAALVSLTPIGNKVISELPFMGGTVDYQSVTYRERLFDRSWQIIRDNPFFGDQYAYLRMQDLRQGQGIIDVVNTYLGVLLGDGFVGLLLFLSFIGIALFKAWSWSKRIARVDSDLGLLGANIAACILATLLLLWDGSFGGGVQQMFYVIAGLAAAYAHFARFHKKGAFRDVAIKGIDKTAARRSSAHSRG